MKRYRKRSWALPIVKGSKPINFAYTTKNGLQGVTDKVMLFCPQFDVNNRASSAKLGTGNGYLNYTQTTPTQWPSCVEESPQLMFVWAMANSLNDSTEQRRTYVWGPRTYHWEFTNQELFPMEFKVYWVRPRRSIDTDATAFAEDLSNWNVGTDVNDVIYRCFFRDRIVTGTTTSLLSELPAAFTPFQSTSFCQLFKVVKVTKTMLDAGKCYKITHRYKKYRRISDLDFADTNYVATGKALIPIVTCIGCPVYDGANIGKVATGACALTWSYKCNIPWYTLNGNTQQYTNFDVAAPSGVINAAAAVYVSKPAAVVVNAAP